MSDDEDTIHYVRRNKPLHYGSLEEQERGRLMLGQEAIQAGIQAGNINITQG